MKRWLAIITLSTFTFGCTTWPDEGQGGWAEAYTPQGVKTDEAWYSQPGNMVETEYDHLALKLQLLVSQGLKDCMPGQLYQATLMQNRIQREITANMLSQAQADLTVWYHQLAQLERHFRYVTAQTQCASAKQPESDFKDLNRKIEDLLNSDNQFAFNNAQVTPKYMTRLAQAAELIKLHSSVRILLVGHADAKGEQSSNFELAFARAEQVKHWLMLYGVAQTQLTTLTQGALAPYQGDVDMPASDVTQHSDRRVNAYILASGTEDSTSIALPAAAKMALSNWTGKLDFTKE
ncbi:OmpA family protein [Pseudoalteromonas tunicata]|uniref:OmpA family protein n=1 Tax=Pseudoalteromonas tunicata TaxID=314281 RepID=UPI00273EB4AA|nr:OmpA family protein [Pseudoalteromonas tunicata]MDP5212906.1 OmpA family protein [Pseudoalteromonas tunicata]